MFDPALDTVPSRRQIIICGTAKLSRDAVISLVKDLYDDDDDYLYLAVILSEQQSDSALHIGEWAVGRDYRLYAYRLGTRRLNPRQQALWLGAEENCHSDSATDFMRRTTKDDILCVAYDASDELTVDLVRCALDAGIPVKDLLRGLADFTHPVALQNDGPSGALGEDDLAALERRLHCVVSAVISATIRDFRSGVPGVR